MTGEQWRFLDSGHCPGGLNMALDEVMLESHLSGETPPTLRVYGWSPPAVSLGRFQQPDQAVDLTACGQLGIDVVRRPTGGRAILHTADEVTFSVVVSAARLGARGVMECYRAIAGAIIRALRLLGAEAQLVERAGPVAAGADPACFAVKARCDLMVGGKKVVGSAQVQRDGFLLQQNSLPLELHLEAWARVFRRQGPAPEAAGLRELLGRQITYAEVAEALRQGFQEHFRVLLVPGGLTERERQQLAVAAPAGHDPGPKGRAPAGPGRGAEDTVPG